MVRRWDIDREGYIGLRVNVSEIKEEESAVLLGVDVSKQTSPRTLPTFDP